MRTFIRRTWFVAGVALAVMTALWWPSAGDALRRLRAVNAGIFLTFLFTGASLDAAGLRHPGAWSRALAAAAVSTLLLVPWAAWLLGRAAFPAAPDFRVGFVLIAAAPVTIASGTVMTAMAGGNVTLSLLICIVCNLASVLTLPLVLTVLLGTGARVALPVLPVLGGLAGTVLAPTLLGLGLRRLIRPALGPWTRPFSQVVVLLIIFNAVSSSADRVAGAGPALVTVFLFAVALHGLALGGHYALARALRLDPPSVAAFTIHVSQKTLTVSYLVWAGHFAAAYPLALLPAIAYHLVQILLDIGVARAFRRRGCAAR